MGAEVCGACHAEQFTAQSKSNHAKALRPTSGPKSITFPPIGIGEESSDPRAAHYNFQENGSRYGVIVTGGTQKTEIPIPWVFGAGDQGQTLFSQFQNGKLLEHRLLNHFPHHVAIPHTHVGIRSGKPSATTSNSRSTTPRRRPPGCIRLASPSNKIGSTGQDWFHRKELEPPVVSITPSSFAHIAKYAMYAPPAIMNRFPYLQEVIVGSFGT